MLVAFPIDLLLGSMLFDAAGRLERWPGRMGQVGAYLKRRQIGFGLLAAVHGVID